MNAQLKRGLIEVGVLASLSKEPSYGYKIISDLLNIMEISESTLYPILRRLQTSNCLITYSEEFNGRLRKYYKITKEGETKLKDFKEEWLKMEEVYNFIVKMEGNNNEEK